MKIKYSRFRKKAAARGRWNIQATNYFESNPKGVYTAEAKILGARIVIHRWRGIYGVQVFLHDSEKPLNMGQFDSLNILKRYVAKNIHTLVKKKSRVGNCFGVHK